MGSNPIIGTSENAFYEWKSATTARSIDSACSRIKTHGLPIYLPSFDKRALAREMGHADGGLIFNHYRQLVRPKDAERYWNIRPTNKDNVAPLVAHA